MFDLAQDWAELPSLRASVEARGSNDMDALPSIDVQPPWGVLDTVVITAAVAGRIVRQESAERAAGPARRALAGLRGHAGLEPVLVRVGSLVPEPVRRTS
ncbi:hypothetical protein [Streptomyces mirabilis]|jgi:hypothetical protein|uniref:Uncharacterized protein n=1 Tax=Streptomyces mirabilis TaxID=68239 RepID=A0A1I2XI43_9ACTN|nr:hypothetical protein [Streptomyces mirabilis]SFH13072.1 hypothetical protein SAMN02787118_14728 [Streptomyces mirabilis]